MVIAMIHNDGSDDDGNNEVKMIIIRTNQYLRRSMESTRQKDIL